jgi:hypothetical protein
MRIILERYIKCKSIEDATLVGGNKTYADVSKERH